VGDDTKLMVNLTRGNIVCERVVIADRPLRRMRGLLGRESLSAGDGMLLQPAPSIHSAFMSFTFDVVFLDRTLRVTRTVEHLRPWRLAAARNARSALELAEGEVSHRGVQVGDQLVAVDAAGGVDGAFLDDAGQAGENGPSLAQPPSANGADGSSRASKVLLVSADRRFRSVASVLLTRRGCSVTVADHVSKVAELARREAATVVLLDASSLPPTAVVETARIEALDPPVGVVVVADERTTANLVSPVLAKWGSFDQLNEAIRCAQMPKQHSP
jgi:uncharacterized membrane protein (UPF0127 family)